MFWSQTSLSKKPEEWASTVYLAPSTFLVSAGGAGCSELVDQILPPRMQDTHNHISEAALSDWQHGHNKSPLSSQVSHHQNVWDTLKVCASYHAMLEASPDLNTWACLLAVAPKESGAWLSTLSVSYVGLRMEDDVMRVAVILCFVNAWCKLDLCPHCRVMVDHCT